MDNKKIPMITSCYHRNFVAMKKTGNDAKRPILVLMLNFIIFHLPPLIIFLCCGGIAFLFGAIEQIQMVAVW